MLALLSIRDVDIISINIFNTSRYQIDVKSYDEAEEVSPLISETQEGRTFVITNTALEAQLGYLHQHKNENNVLLHAKYTKQDKAHWFEKVFNSVKYHGKGGYDVLRSGPIVQASLNITCDRMLTEITNAENWLQRLGRLDRFGENTEVNLYTTVLPETIEDNGKQVSSCAKFLNQLCVWNSTKAWLAFLKDRLDDQDTITINEFYDIYGAFYDDNLAQTSIEKDFLLTLKKSVNVINDKTMDPISVPPKSTHKQGSIKISAKSLRGDNRFVQIAVCEISPDLQLNFPDSYAYNEQFDPNQSQAVLTESINAMLGYGDNDNNLVEFMRKKHHNITKAEGYKKARNEWEIIKQACSPENPI